VCDDDAACANSRSDSAGYHRCRFFGSINRISVQVWKLHKRRQQHFAVSTSTLRDTVVDNGYGPVEERLFVFACF